MIHLDTSFVIDYMREVSRKRIGPASAFLERLPGDEELAISIFVLCELYSGAELSPRATGERKRIEEVCALLHIELPGGSFALRYGKVLAAMHRKRNEIPAMDLLIATSALETESRLVSRNDKHFGKVPGLKMLTY